MDQDIILEEIPKFFQKSSNETLNIFLELQKLSDKNRKIISSREERQRKKKIFKFLEKESFSTEIVRENVAELLSELWIEDSYFSLKSIYSEEDVLQILRYLSIFVIQKNSLKNIKLSTEKSARIIFSLRKYLKTEIRGTPREIHVSEIIESSLSIYGNYIRGIITIEKDYTINPTLICIVDEIQQVFKNIIFNAIQAMYSSETKILRIVLDTLIENEKSFIRISFEDSGKGIDETVAHKLFTPFFTTKSRGEGIGLGLFVSRTIAEEHGGRIEYETLKNGSKFTVILN